jgi:hypothetical protein
VTASGEGVKSGSRARADAEGRAEGMEELSLSGGGGSQTLADVARASFYGRLLFLKICSASHD